MFGMARECLKGCGCCWTHKGPLPPAMQANYAPWKAHPSSSAERAAHPLPYLHRCRKPRGPTAPPRSGGSCAHLIMHKCAHVGRLPGRGQRRVTHLHPCLAPHPCLKPPWPCYPWHPAWRPTPAPCPTHARRPLAMLPRWPAILGTHGGQARRCVGGWAGVGGGWAGVETMISRRHSQDQIAVVALEHKGVHHSGPAIRVRLPA
jgi:hypothetical protein